MTLVGGNKGGKEDAGQYFDGWEQPLKYEMKFRMTIPCNFKLHRYPFGSHVCPGTFYVLNGGQPTMVFQSVSSSNTVEYNGTHDLLEYKLLDITYDNDEENIVLKLHLKSLYDYHVLNSFVPSAIVFLISLTTLFFPLNNFNERIMVSLTVLVVLAALFTQASGASVKTPYFKLLDVWYTSLVALCFSAVVINTIVHALLNRKVSVVGVIRSKELAILRRQEEMRRCMALRFNICAIIALFSTFFCIVLTYIMFAADAF
ncbi:glycine receptor subunit beta-type 4-like [Procambarus clarkii]|uniref:glycine receptor subunit beta-type 4-like n=1 Tax=Procambarus clarkii TaxID=6728 RepID=UPI003743E3D1